MSTGPFKRQIVLPAELEFVAVAEIMNLLWRAIEISGDDDAAFDWGYDGAERVVTAIRFRRDSGKLRLFLLDGVELPRDDDVQRGFLRRDDFVTLAAEAFQAGVTASAANTLSGDVGQTDASTTHKTKRRGETLAAVLAIAEQRAPDASDWASVWAAFVALAQSPDRPVPLLGYAEGEGVKYQTDNPEQSVGFLTREAFRKRFERKR